MIGVWNKGCEDEPLRTLGVCGPFVGAVVFDYEQAAC